MAGTQDNAPFWLHPDPKSARPLVHFVHGNSFPTGTYREFLTYLRSNYEIAALEMHGHNPAYPVTNNWTELTGELIESIEEKQRTPVILVGHSFGGMISLMVARMRPDLVRCVVMLDSPIVSGWRARLLQLVKKIGLERAFLPAKFSKKRRKSWPDQEAVLAHFSSKDMFARWPETVLRDYVYFGVEPYKRGVTLRFKRGIETAIYCTLPHNMSRYCALPFPVPVGFISGTHSEECRQAGLHHTKKLVGQNFMEIEGSHLYPLETPQKTADYVHLMIKKLVPEI